MSWFAVSDHDENWFTAPDDPADPGTRVTDPDALMTRGTIVIEMRLPVLIRPKMLFFYNQGGDWPLLVSVQALPSGGLTLILDQGGDVTHRLFSCSEGGRSDSLRLTYCWDAPSRRARLTLERPGHAKFDILPIDNPKPFRLRDLVAMMQPGENRFFAPEVIYMACSSGIEPVGPVPSLAPETPIATPYGYRAAGDLRRGDIVITPEGEGVPVLCNLARTVPALGSFAPVCLRAPYFGLKQDITVARTQRLVLRGSEVEYLFGREAVLLQAAHVSDGASYAPERKTRFIRYCQLLLPNHEAMDTAGTAAESFYIGRLRRKPDRLRASILAHLERSRLPEHGHSMYPMLKAFEANVLGEHRVA
ncbi:Hint domain-containing protein [Arenibacterium sp. CAU 1754]